MGFVLDYSGTIGDASRLPEMVEALRKAGWNASERDGIDVKLTKTTLHLAFDASGGFKGSVRTDPLGWESHRRHCQVLRVLQRAGAKIEVRDGAGYWDSGDDAELEARFCSTSPAPTTHPTRRIILFTILALPFVAGLYWAVQSGKGWAIFGLTVGLLVGAWMIGEWVLPGRGSQDEPGDGTNG